MRNFRPVVQPLMLPVFDAGHDVLFRRGVALEFIGDDHARNVKQTFEQLAKEPFGGVPVSAALRQDVQNVAVLIDGAPQVVKLAVHGEIDFIEMPLIASLGAATSQGIGEFLAKFQAPLPDGFVTDDRTTCGQQLLDVTKAEAKTVVEPNGVADDFGWEAVAKLKVGIHAYILSDHACTVKLSMRFQQLNLSIS